MEIFIDTNILLNFYHFTNDDLDALNKVFVSHSQGSITLHLTEQVRDEFMRNREGKLQDALKRFRALSLSAQFPYFMKVYDEYSQLQDLTSKFKAKYTDISRKAEDDIKSNSLRADHLIKNIFDKSNALVTDDEIYQKAKMRMEIGNPPGKTGSIGDAINWLLLLANVPNGNDLYLITEDSDFYSSDIIDESEINPFLANEWQALKTSTVRGYRNLNDFLKDHYDGVQLSFDPEKKTLIDALETSGNFARTHALVSKLSDYKYFSLEEAKAILDAADENSQFGWIAKDPDVMDFLKIAVMPHKNNLTKESHKATIEKILREVESNS